MKQKLIAVILSVVLTVTLTACNTTKNTTDPVKDLPKFGFREYTCDFVSGERYLSVEYENLGTERTLTEYGEKSGGVYGAAKSVEKWYYDDTGEHLLKHVSWTEKYATEAEEYDKNGRLILRSAKKQGFYAATQSLHFPGEYSTYSERENKEVGLAYYMSLSITDIKPEVQEIVTEYTYFGESDKIKEIKTVSDSGVVIGLLECGEGDIILSASFDGEYIRYEEKYDPATGRGKFDYELLKNNKVFATAHGTREYNSVGNYTHILVQDEEGPDEGLTIEVFYEYDAKGGYKASTERRSKEGVTRKVRTDWYDAAGKPLRGESNAKGIITEYEYSYYENGNVSRYVLVKDYDSQRRSEGEEYDRTVQEYFEDGRMLSRRTYKYGELTSERTTVFTEMEGVAGKVLYERILYVAGDEEERYSVFMPDTYEPSKTKEVVFRAIAMDEEGNIVDSKQGQFDSEGRLIRTEETYGADVAKAEETGVLRVVEFDEKGRMIRTSTRYWPNTALNSGDTAIDTGKEREYWDGEDPLVAKS